MYRKHFPEMKCLPKHPTRRFSSYSPLSSLSLSRLSLFDFLSRSALCLSHGSLFVRFKSGDVKCHRTRWHSSRVYATDNGLCMIRPICICPIEKKGKFKLNGTESTKSVTSIFGRGLSLNLNVRHSMVFVIAATDSLMHCTLETCADLIEINMCVSVSSSRHRHQVVAGT